MYIDEKITFIVCCPRSGSTWLRLLLNSHPQIACENETFIFTSSAGLGNIFRAYDFELGFKGLQRYISKSDLIDLTKQYLGSIFEKFLERKQKIFVVEKSVDHALCIPLIKEIFPKSKFIHIVRDGRDVAISLTEASKNFKAEYPSNLSAAFDMWNRYNSEIELQLNENQVFLLRYEDLLVDTASKLTSLYKFIGASQLPVNQILSIIKQNDFEQLKIKYKDWGNGNFFREGKINQWELSFSNEDKKESANRIGPRLLKYGY